MHACARCGYPFKETDTFCTVCGAPIPKAKPETTEDPSADGPRRPVWETAKPANPNDIKDDLSDLEEKLNYYIAHPAEAEQIVEHAHEYVSQFFDAGRERLISLLVMDKYFQVTKQTSNC